jgi:hypothetical protein
MFFSPLFANRYWSKRHLHLDAKFPLVETACVMTESRLGKRAFWNKQTYPTVIENAVDRERGK